MAAERIDILGIRIDRLSIEQAIDRCLEVIQNRNLLRVCQVNVEMVMAARRDRELQDLINQSDLVLPNSSGVQWASRRLAGVIIPDRFTSSSFTYPLLEKLNETGSRVLIAGKPKGGSIFDTASFLHAQFPNLEILSFDGSNFSDSTKAHLLAQVRRDQPHLVLLGLGFPLQEQLAQELRNNLKSGIIIGEGGSFDYEQFGGRLRRAPVLWQKLRLEWLWRLILEPSRLGRQLAIPRFIWQVYRRGVK